MISFEVSSLKPSDVQKILQSVVAPRPICFASTIDAGGRINLSPFSFFNLFSIQPPICVFSPSRRMRDNSVKHTLENVQDVPECVINMVDYIFTTNPDANSWIEVGSNIGESATIFLSFKKVHHLYCIDHWEEAIEILKKKLEKEVSSNRCSIYYGSSFSFANLIEDNSADVIYIDADHSLKSVSEDIKYYWPKLKQNGFLCGHDYCDKWPGVIKAVNEFASSIKSNILTFKDASWLIHKV